MMARKRVNGSMRVFFGQEYMGFRTCLLHTAKSRAIRFRGLGESRNLTLAHCTKVRDRLLDFSRPQKRMARVYAVSKDG